MRDICDADLEDAVQPDVCLRCALPSTRDGGLPVGEALAMGKISCSDRASLPEVAGEFGAYIDIADRDASLAVIRGLLSDDAARGRLEAKIRRGYEPVTWHSVAKSVVAACQSAPGWFGRSRTPTRPFPIRAK